MELQMLVVLIAQLENIKDQQVNQNVIHVQLELIPQEKLQFVPNVELELIIQIQVQLL